MAFAVESYAVRWERVAVTYVKNNFDPAEVEFTLRLHSREGLRNLNRYRKESRGK